MNRNAIDRRRLATLAVLCLVALSGCVDFPPEHVVCLSCEQGIEAAIDEDRSISVERSHLEIRVREDGSARWHVRADLAGKNVSELTAEQDRIDRVADAAVTDELRIDQISRVAVHEGAARNVSARAGNATLEITFTVPDAGRESVGGVLLVEQFHSAGGEPSAYQLGTDRVVVRGPPGTVVANDPPGGTVTEEENAVVWKRTDGKLDAETYVAFAPDRRPTTRAAVAGTVAVRSMQWLVPKLRIAVPGSILLGTVTVAAVVSVRRRRSTGDEANSEDGVFGPPAPLGGIGVAIVAIGSVGAIVAATVDVGGFARGTIEQLFTWPPIVPLLVFGLLGWDSGRGSRWRRPLLVAILLLPFVAATPSIARPETVWFDGELLGGFWLSILATLVLGPVSFWIGYLNGRTVDRNR